MAGDAAASGTEIQRYRDLRDDRGLVDSIRQLFAISLPAERAALYLVAPGGVSRFGSEAFPPEPWSDESVGLSDCLKQGRAYHQPHLTTPVLPGEKLALDAGMRSAWYLPLVRQGKLVGWVGLYSAAEGAGTPADITVLAPLLEVVTALVLERHLRNLERDMLQAQTELAATEKLSALGQLAEGVAHAVNNPAAYVLVNLEHVRGLVEVTADQEVLPDRRDELLGAIDEGVEGMRRIRDVISDLGLLSHATDDQVESVDVNRVVQAVVGMTSHQVSARARVELDLGPVSPIASNKARLTQVLLDLVLNASQACSAEERDMNVVRVRTHGAQGRVDVSVSDTGSGIGPEELPHIFEPFFTTKPTGQGSGLGLAVARSLVRGMGGRIRFDTREGLGTTFTIELPDVRPPDTEPRVSSRATTSPPPRPRVLVVDDEAGIRRALQRALKRDNDVTLAKSGEEAIELLKGGLEVELVISDLLLPGKTGIDIHACIARDRPELLGRTLFVTGGAVTQKAREFVAAHPYCVLCKPVDGPRLHAIIQAVAGGASVRRAIEQTRRDSP